MKSKWFELKEEAIKLRKNGMSIGKVERRLGISRSTLSGWFKNIELTPTRKKKLLLDWQNGLVKARKEAVRWHNAQKEKRLKEAKKQAQDVIKSLDTHSLQILELALAMLYLGEGTKKKIETSLGSSDPFILRFFIGALKRLYNVNMEKVGCQLHLRADQNPQAMRRYWAKQLGLSLGSFKHVNIDKRTIGTSTYSNYKGVCSVRCGGAAIQRRLVFLADLFCKQVINKDVYLKNTRP